MENLISVIVPVYNAEKYLKKCIDSILGQSYKKLEVILVNDGSSDSSAEICDEYSYKDYRVKVVHKNNAGPGEARSDGVNIALGKYITFVDADDYIEKNMYQEMLKYEKYNFDIIQCGYSKVKPNGQTIAKSKLENVEISGTYECAFYQAAQINTTNFLWNKLIKASLFKNVIFPKFYVGEDACILTQLYARANQVITINELYYNYVMTPDSLCRTAFSEKKLDNIHSGKYMYKYYKKTFPELSVFSALHICSYAAKNYCELYKYDYNDKAEILNELHKVFNEYYQISKGSKIKKMSSKRRLFFIESFHINRKFSSLIYNLIV